MPTNAPPEYYVALEKAKSATDLKEKLKWLLEAYKIIPKHKGTENERKILMQRISKIRKQLENLQKKQTSSKQEDTIKKEGEFRIVLFGYPNTYKSTILKYFTNKDVKIDIYPYTTTEPEVGAIDYKGAKIQIIELPGFKENYEGKYLSILQSADVIILTATSTEQIDDLLKFLESKKIVLKDRPKKEKIKLKRATDKYNITGLHLIDISKEEIIELLKSYGYKGCELTILEECTVEDLIDILEHKEYKKGLIITPLKIDEYKNLKVLKLTGNLEEDKKRLIENSGYIEVYLKPPKKEVSPTPILVKKGSKVMDVFYRFFDKKQKPKQIRLRKKDGKFIFISGDYILKDKDIIEFVI